MTIDRLFVIWSAPENGARYVVGHLSREGEGFRFWYAADLSTAYAAGFRLLTVFPDHRTETDPYTARYLFTTFADRIPSPERPDARDMLRAWGVVNDDDQFEVLAKSGGLRATDRIELAEFRSSTDELRTPLEFRVAGGKHVPDLDRAAIKVGERLELRREPGNQFDRAATLVAARTGRVVGYVPRQYSEFVAHLLDASAGIEAQAVRELAVPDDAGRWIVRLARQPS